MHQKCCLLASVYSLFVLLVSSLVWDRRACAGVASHLLPYTVPTWPICKTLDTSTTDRSSGTNKMQQLIRVNNNKKKWKLSPMSGAELHGGTGVVGPQRISSKSRGNHYLVLFICVVDPGVECIWPRRQKFLTSLLKKWKPSRVVAIWNEKGVWMVSGRVVVYALCFVTMRPRFVVHRPARVVGIRKKAWWKRKREKLV